MLRPQALDAFAAGDADGFLLTASNDFGLDLVWHNIEPLRDARIYERALLTAFFTIRTNNARWPMFALRLLFLIADRKRLLEISDPLPEGERFVLYRGVAGRGNQRRVRGMSWTDDQEQAVWFAKRFSSSLADPAVYTATVGHSEIYAHINTRKENEYVVVLDKKTKAKKVKVI